MHLGWSSEDASGWRAGGKRECLMHERFSESARAASYVTTGLMADYPDATAEVIQVVKNKPRHATCETREIGPVLESMCKSFPMASVDYHPDNPYGFVAEIRCYGETGLRTAFRPRQQDSPRVIILLTRVGKDDVVVGSRAAPSTAHEDAAPRAER